MEGGYRASLQSGSVGTHQEWRFFVVHNTYKRFFYENHANVAPWLLRGSYASCEGFLTVLCGWAELRHVRAWINALPGCKAGV